ncbi:uncharacterized protein LOC134771786 [Penaeus indicus]|uniref:uncharacterized protein LOC134771786 n=1 Tax=Penaeus indicus TaxID=29960 RepID=UPI00300C7032
MIFAARQIQEKCREKQQPFYELFVDLTKAFDTVSRESLWLLLRKYSCPPGFIKLVRRLHDGMEARIISGTDTSEPFSVSHGVKQGCVIAPTLFGLFLGAMVAEATRDLSCVATIRHRTSGGLFTTQHLKAKTKVTLQMILDLLYADDTALVAHSEADLQQSLDRLHTACHRFGLKISVKKTVVLFQPALGGPNALPKITIDDQLLQVVDKFAYLGSCISSDGTMDAEIDCRIAKASAAFGALQRRVWSAAGIRRSTKVKVYQAMVLLTLLYGCEAWTCYAKHLKRLEAFHQRKLRSLLGISWKDHITNAEVLARAGLPSVEARIRSSQLRWVGHVVRMPEHRLPKQILYSELEACKRPVAARVSGSWTRRKRLIGRRGVSHYIKAPDASTNLEQCGGKSREQGLKRWLNYHLVGQPSCVLTVAASAGPGLTC